mmetsp:Transcript_81982/g.100587  ORF Transcript_81982/g.100587 Transcript_81982/m.100587 type:complete len:302 (+) Transcript_81982:37-942(+)
MLSWVCKCFVNQGSKKILKPGVPINEDELKIDVKLFTNQNLAKLCQCIRCKSVNIPSYGIDPTNEIVCYGCKNDDERVNEGPLLTNILLKQEILCLNTCNNGGNNAVCKWKNKVSLWREHSNGECPLAMVVCEYCEIETTLRKDMKDHHAKCDEKEEDCKDCNKPVKRRLMRNHVTNECEYVKMMCENNGCNRRIMKKHYNNHVNNECPKRIVSCEYRKYGCNDDIVFEELEQHNMDNELNHFKMESTFNVNELRTTIAGLKTEKAEWKNSTYRYKCIAFIGCGISFIMWIKLVNIQAINR